MSRAFPEARFPAFRFCPPGATDGQRQYRVDVAAKEAADRPGITEDQLASGGYTVRTTFDLPLQDSTAEQVKGLKSAKGGVRLHTAVVGIEPGDRAVRVLYGGSDYARQPFNDAVSGAVEAGSVLGPLAGMRFGAPLTAVPKTAAPTPLRLTSAYAAVAADGVYAAPYTVTGITGDGRTVYSAHPERRRVLPEKTARAAAAPVRGGRQATPVAGPPANLFTAGAGGGTTRRTVWTVAYDARLTLTVVLFADKPGEKKDSTVPAQLPTYPSPTGFTEQAATQLRGRLR
ncbi:hypothetical protein AB0L59_21290 [Streptomyces sp. NPDC052109]|uniref:hypothetical protein n=1 Tax=Streptomyces sp. NPDC052109 TaxID=3155527 RepID=UPI003416BF13